MYLVGSDTVTIDSALRIRLSKAWTDHGEQEWLLFPRHLVRRHTAAPGWLVLLPVPSSATPSLEPLRASAYEFGLSREVVTRFRTTPDIGWFKLTRAQQNWLEVSDRLVVLSGVLVHAHLCSPRRWAEWLAS